jgi:hypothetical protein
MATTSVSVDTFFRFNLGYADLRNSFHHDYDDHEEKEKENYTSYGMHVEDVNESMRMLSEVFDE